jgi:aconitate hydratase
LLGATNAFTAEVGKGLNVASGATGEAVAAIARDYRSRGLRWAVVGDANYGEGSSREHAALSPRLLGGAAVIARSFARIHESNLKKQGLLALTFSDPADYDRVREDDRIDLIDLAGLAPERSVTAVLRHADATTEALSLRHSYTASQLDWFRDGSALNGLDRTPEARPGARSG